MENATAQIPEAVRKDRTQTPKPRPWPESPASIDMDNLETFRPLPVSVN